MLLPRHLSLSREVDFLFVFVESDSAASLSLSVSDTEGQSINIHRNVVVQHTLKEPMTRTLALLHS